jgi:hypothetical protein
LALYYTDKMLRAFSLRRFSSLASKWTFSPAPVSGARFTGEVFIGAGGLLGGGANKLKIEGPLKAASTAPQPCSPPPDAAYVDNKCAEGLYTYSVGEKEVGTMLIARTPNNEGIFEDSAGRVYLIDGGAVAIMSGAIIPPVLRAVAQPDEQKPRPFSLGHLVQLPVGAPVRVSARGGRIEFALDDGAQRAPLLVLDTGDRGDSGAEDDAEGEDDDFEAELGDAAGKPASELVRLLRARPDDAALALSVFRVLAYRSGLAMKREDAEKGKALSRAVLDDGGFELLRVVLERHYRSSEVAFVGFLLLEHLSIADTKGFSQLAAPLVPTLVAALAAHNAPENKAILLVLLRAADRVMEDSSVVSAAIAAGLPARVIDCLKVNMSDDGVTLYALYCLGRLARVPGFLRGTDAKQVIEAAVKAYPNSDRSKIGNVLLKLLDLGQHLS